MSSVVKGNRPLRIFALMILLVLSIAQFMGQIDLMEVSFLWLIIAMAINAIQATFTGFCPMFKNARGECVACGVACDTPACQPENPSEKAVGSSGEGCCADKPKS